MTANVIMATQFLDSLAGLTDSEKGRALEFVNTFRKNPANPGTKLERVRNTRSKDLWAGRVSRDLRAIFHKDGDTWALLHVGHHDPAYQWAERRDVGRHSTTGALQVIELVEGTHEVTQAFSSAAPQGAPPLLDGHADDYLLSLGVPDSWLPTLRAVLSEDQLLEVCGKLPADVSERLLILATGQIATPPTPVPPGTPITDAPDTRNGFYVLEDTEDVETAFRAPMERWITFLHPAQRALVEQRFSGPARVSGSAGTGKTVVAMHRARHLAREGENVLLTSYVHALCENINQNLRILCTESELKSITVSTVHKQALDLARGIDPKVRPATTNEVRDALEQQRAALTPDHDKGFVRSEWERVIRAQGIETWDEYRDAQRTGRGHGLSVKERKRLWQVFDGTLKDLESRDRLDWPGICQRARKLLETGQVPTPYTAVVVDEVQDLKPPELRFLVALCGRRLNNLMVCGDTGQRIYPGGFSLGSFGIEVRGRSRILRINYRTTEQIRRRADQLVGPSTDDMDGGEEQRANTQSLFGGPEPRFVASETRESELAEAVNTIRAWSESGFPPEAIGSFARTKKRVDKLAKALGEAGIPWQRISDRAATRDRGVQLGTMHGAKGLEFRAVLVLGASEKEVPNRVAVKSAFDPTERESAEAQERRLLYVSMTRAREELVVSWSGQPSPFLAPVLEQVEVSRGV